MTTKKEPNTRPTIEELKQQFLEYYRKLPNKSLAAGYVGRDRDTIISWENNDAVFSAAVRKAKSDFATTKLARIRDDKWILSHTLRDEFADRTEITGPDGQSLKIDVIAGDGYRAKMIEDARDKKDQPDLLPDVREEGDI